MEVVRHCNRCGVQLVHTVNWGVDDLRRRKYRCKPCKNTRQTELRAANRDEVRRLDVINQRKRKYGLDNETYISMLDEQNHCCKICGKPFGEGKNSKNVDHCHDTNRVRGILCTPCNTALGFLKDDTTLLEKAILYLKG